jgi:hypothetical protein
MLYGDGSEERHCKWLCFEMTNHRLQSNDGSEGVDCDWACDNLEMMRFE